MEENKEDFCVACVAGATAVLGAGVSTAGSKDQHRTKKKIMFWSGITLVVLSLLVAVYVLWYRKCSDCA